MNQSLGVLMLSAVVLAVSACGGDDDDAPQPKVTVDELNTGRYVVSLGDPNAPTVGKYYAAADGSRLLVIVDGNDQTRQVYRRTAGDASWTAAPASSQDVDVTLLRSDTVTSTTPAVAALAGNYVSLAAPGITAAFSISTGGDIVAGASACKLSGKLSNGLLPNTLKLSLATTGCGSLPASAGGVVTLDVDDAPARFRMVADNGTQLVDLWAYAE